MPDEPTTPRDDEAVRRFVEHMAMAWSDYGFPRMPARVLITMMAADEPALTAAQLSERLGVSPAAISGAVRYLIQIGMLAREPAPNSRRDRYRLPDDAWYESMATKGGFFKANIDLATEGVEALGGRRSPAGRRVADMRDFFSFMQNEILGLAAKWQASKAD
ncbi:MAG TPA: MarR family transcriptional regulator [Catenuloplanes sp.]|jgi:DNA-binding transcriptional regulator GbsR (MarR family)